MAVDNDIRRYIDTHLLDALPEQAFQHELEVIVLDIFALLSTDAPGAAHTANYLGYALSRRYMRSANHGMQAQYARQFSALLSRLYNDNTVISRIAPVSPWHSYPVLLMLYRVHYALTMNGLRAVDGPLELNIGDALRMLQIVIGATRGPWQAHLLLQGGFVDYHHGRIRPHAGAPLIEIGRSRRPAAGLDILAATWNLQGSSESQEHKWRTRVLQLARANDVVMIQEAGIVPPSSHLVTQSQVQDQFGVTHQVDQYLWEVGTAARSEAYQLYFLDVSRLRVNLAIVVAAQTQLDVRQVVVVADGLPAADGAPGSRPALGLRVRRRQRGGPPPEEVTLLNVHALSGGGANAPRLLREISWHTDSPFALLGDFNRDPRPADNAHPGRGDWISPMGIARAQLASGPTHPATSARNMLDYAMVNGSLGPVLLGQVGASGPSDHLPVCYQFHFL